MYLIKTKFHLRQTLLCHLSQFSLSCSDPFVFLPTKSFKLILSFLDCLTTYYRRVTVLLLQR